MQRVARVRQRQLSYILVCINVLSSALLLYIAFFIAVATVYLFFYLSFADEIKMFIVKSSLYSFYNTYARVD